MLRLRKGRRGQTAVEYLLVTVSLLFVFVIMFKALQYALANQFKRGGLVIIKMYKQDPW
jgi:Flp pilus assembly pilin Flp